jgi:hypothetical protein
MLLFATGDAAGLLANLRRWNRAISIFAALSAALVVLLLTWALAIRFGGWFGVFLGWWPAMLIASAAAYLIGRFWHALALIAAAALLLGGPGALVGDAAATTRTVIALVGDHHAGSAADPTTAQRPVTGKSG